MDGELQLDDAAFGQAVGQAGRIHDELARAHDALGARVSALLGSGWTGEAAREYAEAWGEWEGGAERVLAGLDHLLAVMTQVRSSLLELDDDEELRMGRVRARLGAGR